MKTKQENCKRKPSGKIGWVWGNRGCPVHYPQTASASTPTNSVGVSSKLVDDKEQVRCNRCGKRVSTEVPKGTIVRAWVECPECIEKDKPQTDKGGGWEDAFYRVHGENILELYKDAYRYRYPDQPEGNISFEAGMDCIEFIQGFIRSTLAFQRFQVVEVLESLKKVTCLEDHPSCDEEDKNYNKTLKDAIQKISGGDK